MYSPFFTEKKSKFFEILSYLSSHFCTVWYLHNVEILLKRTDRGIAQRHKRDCAHGLPVLHCLGGDAWYGVRGTGHVVLAIFVVLL